MSKYIVFCEYPAEDAIVSWKATELAVDIGDPYIRTTQMGFLMLHNRLRDLGYQILINESPTSEYEIRIGSDNERTKRAIKKSHNLFKLWLSGEFVKKGDE